MSPLQNLRYRIGPYATRVVVVSALLLVLFVVLLILTNPARGTYEVRAVFDDVRGLIPGGEVRAGAIGVGSVTSVELNEADEPEVTMRVDNSFRLHEGAQADIRLGSNVGAVNRAVELIQGDTSAPELPDGATLRDEATDQPVNFDLAVETLRPPTRERIKRLLIGLDEALVGRGEDFDRLLRTSGAALNETANLLAQVSADGEALRTLVGQGETVLSALASSPEDVGEAAERTASLLATTAGRQRELRESVERMGPAIRGGRQALARLADSTPRLRTLVAELDPVVDELGPLARLLPRATNAAGPFLRETRALVEGGPRDLRRFRPVIGAAESIAGELDGVIRRALPLAQELRVYSPEIIGFFQNFGAATGGYDAVGHVLNLASGTAQLPPPAAMSRTLGPGDCGPGMLEMPLIRLPGAIECETWANYEDSFIYPTDEGR